MELSLNWKVLLFLANMMFGFDLKIIFTLKNKCFLLASVKNL